MQPIPITAISPQIEPQAIDQNIASVAFLESRLKNKVTAPIKADQTLEDALSELLSNTSKTDDTGIDIKYHCNLDEDAKHNAPTDEPTAYACRQSLADVHAFKSSIRKGTQPLRPR
jgi:hypothetical protein